MKLLTNNSLQRRQTGVVLFMALIALVAMTLAGIALVRSVDTATLIAGNLSFKQAGSRTADIGVEQAIAWLEATDLANNATNPATDAAHPFNKSGTDGYYSHMNADPTVAATWSAGSKSVVTYAGNEVDYIIQRMCRLVDKPADDAECLYSDDDSDKSSHKVCHYGDDCGQVLLNGRSPIYSITARVKGPKNTLSYVQAKVF